MIKTKAPKIIPVNHHDRWFLLSHPKFFQALKRIKPPDEIKNKVPLSQINYFQTQQGHRLFIDYYNLAAIGITSKKVQDLTNQALYERLFILQSKLDQKDIIPRYNMNQFQLIYDCNQNRLQLGRYYNQIFYHDKPITAFKKLKIAYQFQDLNDFLKTDLDQLIATIKTNSQSDQNHFYQDLPNLVNQIIPKDLTNYLTIKIKQVYQPQSQSTIDIKIQTDKIHHDYQKFLTINNQDWHNQIEQSLQNFKQLSQLEAKEYLPMPNQLIKNDKDLAKLKEIIQILNLRIFDDVEKFVNSDKFTKDTSQDLVRKFSSYNNQFELIDHLKELVKMKNYQAINNTINRWKQSDDLMTQAYANFIDYSFQPEQHLDKDNQSTINKKSSPQI